MKLKLVEVAQPNDRVKLRRLGTAWARGAAVAATVLALSTAASSADTNATNAARDASRLAQSISACRAISSVAERVNCYDHIALPSLAGSPMPSPVLTQAAPMSARPAEPSGPGPVQSADQKVPASAPWTPDASVFAEKPKPGPVTSESLRSDTHKIVLTIKEVTRTDQNMLRMVTSDGITWVQSQDKKIRKWPSAGDPVQISRGYLGYTCRTSKKVSFHCKPPYGLDGTLHRNGL